MEIKQMINRFKILSLSLFTIMMISSCDSQPKDEQQTEQQASKPRVALIMKSLANEFFVNMAEGAKAHQLAHSEQYELIVNGIKNESDLAQQVALIDQMIASKVDAIVIAPADSKAIVPALARAEKAGIKVVNIDNRLDDTVLNEFSMKIPHVGPDNKSGARLVGDYLTKTLTAGDQVAILEGIQSSINSIARRDGFKESAEAAGLNVVTIQSASWDQTKAAELTSAILIQYPELKAIMAANDNMALGAVSAVMQSSDQRKISIVGFDNISAIHAQIKEGHVLATADQHGDLLAVYGIEFALKMIDGIDAGSGKQTPVDLITIEQLSEQAAK